MKTPGYDDVDTSAPDGKSYEWKERNRLTEAKSYSSRVFQGVRVRHVDMDVNGYHVTVNHYSDDGQVQVFIDNPDYENKCTATMELSKVDEYIRVNTQ